jgi:hypothetical protein
VSTSTLPTSTPRPAAARTAGGACQGCGYVNATQAPGIDRMVCGGCGDRVKLTHVCGSYSDAMPCDSRCQYATGPVCSCQCGGDNHQAGYIDPGMVPVWVRDRDRARHAGKADRAQERADAARVAADARRADMIADRPELGELCGDRYRESLSGFIIDMRTRINAGETLTPAQRDAVCRIVATDRKRDAAAAERATREAAATAKGVICPTGRETFTGRIVNAQQKTDYRFNFHGKTTVQITVATAAGWTVTGTAPAAMAPDSYNGDEYQAWIRGLTGQDVTLTATVKPGTRSPLSGFFSRPTLTAPGTPTGPVTAPQRAPRPARCHRHADPAVCQHTPPCHPAQPATPPAPVLSPWATYSTE